MSNQDKMRDKIRAMLAKAKPGSGATEDEAASAMAMAMTLMAKYGLQVSLEEGEDAQPKWGGPTDRNNYMMWHNECAGAAALLYSCRHFIWTTDKGFQFEFVGRPDNTDAAKITFLWLTDQVEALYKEALPPGLSKSTRAELRRTFKYACAIRIRGRAWQMMQNLRNDNNLALAATGSTALVIVKHDDALQAEAAELIKEKSNGKALTVRPRKAGIGTVAGFRAGDRVQLTREIGNRKLQIEDKR